MAPSTENMDEVNIKDLVLEGPDLNISRTPLDKKQYRQIIIKKNGLRVVLISDTEAMIHQEHFEYESESEDEDDEKMSDSNDNQDDDDDDDDESFEDDGIRKAAAAIIVGAGSYHDPECAQGMAHFLEHMLFMGTEKYPKENQYDAFLSKHSGSDNAYTELEHTMYHMECSQEKFFEALDMLSQFFIAPLMLKDSVDRELNAIESEFQLSKNSDECRLQQLLCHDCSLQTNNGKKHPFCNFSWGNTESLKDIPMKNGVDMMQELRTFYNRHYYAQNMSLCVIGAYSLDELEKHVVESFSDVPAFPRVSAGDQDNEFYESLTIQRENPGTWEVKAHTPIQNFGMPFNSETLGRICRIIPVKDKNSLSITWQIPPQWQNWRSKPCDYIAHLLGHEAAGSILSALKRKNWVNECYAGVGTGGYENSSSHALFCLQLTLSVDGVENWAEILELVFVYIGMIRYYCKSDDGLPKWIYEELRAIQELSHKFDDEPTPMDLVEDIADCLAPYNCLPPERLLDGDALLFEYDAKAIEDLLDNYFTPQNSRVDLVSSSFGRAEDFEDHVTDLMRGKDLKINSSNDYASSFKIEECGEALIEPIFGTRYYAHRIDAEIMEKWDQAFRPQMPPAHTKISLPPVNPFIPTSFELKKLPHDDSNHPLLFTSLKICVTVGKRKVWFPCTCNKFDKNKNKLLLTMEDGEEKWYTVDTPFDSFEKHVHRGSEGTFDKKAVKYKVISVPKNGEGAILKYGDDSDFLVEDGLHFPHIPPPQPASRLPQLLVNTQLLKLYHLQDRKFSRPIGEIRLKINMFSANKIPLYKACAELLAIILHDVTTETCYLASVCEIGNHIEATDVGFTIRVHGFDDKLLELVAEMLRVFFSFKTSSNEELPEEIPDHRFDACLEILRRKYGNVGMKASSLCSDLRLRCLRSTIWSSSQKSKAIESITRKEFMKVMSVLFSKISIECLYHGNFDKTDVESCKNVLLEAANVAGLKGMQKKNVSSQEVGILPQKGMTLNVPSIDPKEPNTAVEIYFQCGKDDMHERVVIDLLTHIMYEPFFDQLRTKEQFGYSVSVGSRWTYGIVGACFKVVSNCKSADDISMRVDTFLLDFKKELEEMNRQVFMEHVIGLANDKLQKWNSLEEESGSFWSEIVEGRFDFEVHRNEVEALKKVKKADLLDAFHKCISPDNPKRRKLEVRVIGIKERPVLSEGDCAREAGDKMVKDFHKQCKSTWGKIF